MTHDPDNPWAKPTRKTGGHPQKPKGSQGGPYPPPPDIEELLRRFNFGGGKGGFPKGVISLILLGIIALWFASGIYRVLPEEQGVILRFGALARVVDQPGLGYHMPWPIETMQKANVTFERRLEIGFRNVRGGEQDITTESLMLSGDANIVDLDFVVQWKIGSLKDYLFNVRDPEGTIKKVAESAMREVVGQNNLQLIITEKRADVAERVKNTSQNILNSYGPEDTTGAGVVITQVLIEDATVPPPVMDSFEDVIRADQDAETAVNKAEEYRNDIVPRARGKAIQMIQSAEGYREQAINTAKGEADRFLSVLASYKGAKDVTRTRLYLETMEAVLGKGQTVVMDQEGGALPYLSLDEMRRKKSVPTSGNSYK